ncbi:immunity protein YezG family protein [Bacillus altitudinis]|uniref:immunity protein YezG family protein n=1 Tax=Bacillus altitudinis TaxID=293387 RepID=UPI003CF50D8C
MKKIEINYKEISATLNEMIPCNWGKVWLYAEIVDDSSEITFYFCTLDDEELVYGHKIPKKYNLSESIYDDFLISLYDSFERLKEEYIKNDLGVWTTATLQLDHTGKFSIEYGYDDIYSLGIDNVQRIAVWEYETFGFLPDDEEDKEVVLNYIKNKEKKM